MPLPLTVYCFSKIQIGFAFLVPAHPGSPGKMAVKRVCVCVCVFLSRTIHYLSAVSVLAVQLICACCNYVLRHTVVVEMSKS